MLTIDREKTAGPLDPQDRLCCPALVTDISRAYLSLRRHAVLAFGSD